MKTRVQIVCKDGEMFVMHRDRSLHSTLEELTTALNPEQGEGVEFDVFGRGRWLLAGDVAEIEVREVDR